MKKIIIAVALVAIILTVAIIMTGCSDSRTYKRVHIIESGKCYKISNYAVLSYGSCRTCLENGDRIFLSQGTYFLVSDKCPICDHE